MSRSPQLALGQVETIGLPTAIAAADAGVKSADVLLVGYELARGGGFVDVKFVGQVGAVKAAVAAAKVAATKIGKVATSSVIARPSDQILTLIHSSATVGVDQGALARLQGEPEPAPQPAPGPGPAPHAEPQSGTEPAPEEEPDPVPTELEPDAPTDSLNATTDEGEEK